MIFKIRLTIGGTEYPVAGASIQAPEGALGFSITVALAQRIPTGITPGASVTLEVGVRRTTADAYTYVPLIADGRLMGRNYNLSWERGKPGRPGDLVEFNALSSFGDRWQLRPLRPVTLFNPDIIPEASLIADTSNLIRDGITGSPVTTVLEPVAGLNLRQVLDRAYTTRGGAGGVGCGFTKVITNLPNFPVDRVDFDLAGGWHQAAASLVAIFEPIYFELDNILYILDPGLGLPGGLAPRSLSPDCVGRAEYIIAPGEVVNTIILSYQTRDPLATGGTGGIAGLIPSTRFEDEPEVITGAGANLTRTQVTRTIKDWKDLATGQVAYSQEIERETRTYSYYQGSVRLVSQETLQVDYQGKLKVGHLKVTSALYPNPDVRWPTPAPGEPQVMVMKFGEVHTETSLIDWTVDPLNVGESIERRVITETEGLCLVEGRATKRYTPILDAAKNSTIKGNGTQTTARKPIDTMIDELQESGYNQAQIVTRIIHHLTGTIETPPPTISRTGSPSTAGGRGAGTSGLTTLRELITLPSSIAADGARRAASLDVGLLNPVDGRLLAKRKLQRLASPRKRATITIPNGIDFLIHRGSVIRPPLRAGLEGTYIVTGYTITLRGLTTREPSIDHVLQGIEVG